MVCLTMMILLKCPTNDFHTFITSILPHILNDSSQICLTADVYIKYLSILSVFVISVKRTFHLVLDKSSFSKVVYSQAKRNIPK